MTYNGQTQYTQYTSTGHVAAIFMLSLKWIVLANWSRIASWPSRSWLKFGVLVLAWLQKFGTDFGDNNIWQVEVEKKMHPAFEKENSHLPWTNRNSPFFLLHFKMFFICKWWRICLLRWWNNSCNNLFDFATREPQGIFHFCLYEGNQYHS